MNTLEIAAPAKINLFLKIINKRKDGYHTIESVFEKISLCDRLYLKRHRNNEIVVASNSPRLSSLGKNNLVYKAADYLRRKTKAREGVFIYLEKNIPLGAGLGGGSSDAAAAIKGLNRLWQLGLSTPRLIELAGAIGSDVPLFIPHSRFLIGTGRGDRVRGIAVADSFRLWHILIIADVSVSTPYAYSLFDKYFCERPTRPGGLHFAEKMKLTIPGYSANIITHALLKKDVSLLNYYSYNSFKDIVINRFPQIARLKKKLEALTTETIHLSGSGSSLFITLARRKEAERLVKKIRNALLRCQCIPVSTYA